MDQDLIEPVASQPQIRVPPEDSVEQYGRAMATGALLIFVIQISALPISVLISVLLARWLGPSEYGLYAVAASIVAWLQVSITTLFNRSAIKLIAEAEGEESTAGAGDWQTVTSALVALQFLFGVTVAVILFLLAPWIAAALGTPNLVLPLHLFTLGIPIFAMAKGYASALIGRRAFGRGALFPAIHSIVRLTLVFILVGAGWGVTGAVLATIGGLCAELVSARIFIRPPLFTRARFPLRRFLRYSLPLSLDSLSRRLTTAMDLWVVQAVSGSATAGLYGAADNFSISASLVGTSLSAPLLATVTHLWKNGQTDGARAIICQVLRLSLGSLPFAALGAGAAPGIISLIYGNDYLPAAPFLAWLSFAAVATLLANVTTSVLAAIGRPGTTFAVTGPMLLPGLALTLFLVSRAGATGAAAAAACVTWAGALGTLAALYRSCGAGLGRISVVRVGVVSLIAFALASLWHVSGAWVVPQLLTLSGGVLLLLGAFGELTRNDLAFAFSLFKRDSQTDRLDI